MCKDNNLIKKYLSTPGGVKIFEPKAHQSPADFRTAENAFPFMSHTTSIL